MLYVHAMLMLFQEMYRRSRSKFFRICALSFCKKDQGNIICPNEIDHLLVSKLYQQIFVETTVYRVILKSDILDSL